MNKKTYNHDLLCVAFKKSRLSYRALADMAGVSRMTLWDTINGDTDPAISTVNALFSALGINPMYALDSSLRKSDFPELLKQQQLLGGKAGGLVGGAARRLKRTKCTT